MALEFHHLVPRVAEPYAVTDFVFSPDGRTALKAATDVSPDDDAISGLGP